MQVSSVAAKNKTRMVTIFVCCKYRGNISLVEDTLALIKVYGYLHQVFLAQTLI